MNVQDNVLETVPADLGKCRRLRLLLLDRNAVRVLPSALAHCRALEVLSVAGNPQLTVPASADTTEGMMRQLCALERIASVFVFLFCCFFCELQRMTHCYTGMKIHQVIRCMHLIHKLALVT